MPRKKNQIPESMPEKMEPKPRVLGLTVVERPDGLLDVGLTGCSHRTASDVERLALQDPADTVVIQRKTALIHGLEALIAPQENRVITPGTSRKPRVKTKAKLKPVKGPRTPVTKNDLLAERFFREVTNAGDAGISAEDLAKTLKLSGPRGFKAVFACLNRVYAADHPMRTVQFPAIKRETKDGKVRYVYRPDAEQAPTS